MNADTCPSPGTLRKGPDTPPTGSLPPTAEAHGMPDPQTPWPKSSSGARPSPSCQQRQSMLIDSWREAQSVSGSSLTWRFSTFITVVLGFSLSLQLPSLNQRYHIAWILILMLCHVHEFLISSKVDSSGPSSLRAQTPQKQLQMASNGSSFWLCCNKYWPQSAHVEQTNTTCPLWPITQLAHTQSLHWDYGTSFFFLHQPEGQTRTPPPRAMVTMIITSDHQLKSSDSEHNASRDRRGAFETKIWTISNKSKVFSVQTCSQAKGHLTCWHKKKNMWVKTNVLWSLTFWKTKVKLYEKRRLRSGVWLYRPAGLAFGHCVLFVFGTSLPVKARTAS